MSKADTTRANVRVRKATRMDAPREGIYPARDVQVSTAHVRNTPGAKRSCHRNVISVLISIYALLIPEGHHRVQPGGTMRGQHACRYRDEGEQHNRYQVGHQVGGFESVK